MLGVGENSSQGDIKKAFRKLSLQHHPDRGGDAEEFKKINEAYSTLGDVEKKRMYDMRKNNPFMPGGVGGMDGVDDIFWRRYTWNESKYEWNAWKYSF